MIDGAQLKFMTMDATQLISTNDNLTARNTHIKNLGQSLLRSFFVEFQIRMEYKTIAIYKKKI